MTENFPGHQNIWSGRDVCLICQTPFQGEAAVCFSGNYRLSKTKQNRTKPSLTHWHRQGWQNRKQQVLGQDVQTVGIPGSGAGNWDHCSWWLPKKQSRLGLPGMRAALDSIPAPHKSGVMVHV